MRVKAYQTTDTPVARSQEQIRHILSRYGADGVQFAEDWSQRLILVRFLYSVNGHQHTVLFRVPIPQAEAFSQGGRARTEKQMENIQRQYERGIWRAVFWAIKSRMEAVEFGIETFEEAFLSHFEIPGTDRQIGEVLIPRLATLDLKQLER